MTFRQVKMKQAQHDFNKDVPIPTESIKIIGHQNLDQHSQKGKIPKKRNKHKKDNLPNIPMKSTLQVFKNQLRPDLTNNNSKLKLTDSSSNISNRTVLFTNALKLQNTSFNPIGGAQ